jgi:thymidylate synthase (FAD)
MPATLIAYTQPTRQQRAAGVNTLEDLVAYCARVSNPSSQLAGMGVPRLLRYMINHKHWSPFEVVSITLEVETPRDIARQLLRHRSFSFQEFSQRYAAVEAPMVLREARLQDPKNRQSSLPVDSPAIADFWHNAQTKIAAYSTQLYAEALEQGIAKEVARAVLPEGLTPSRLYVHGTLRSWIHYIELRSGPETQLEHRLLARECAERIETIFPLINEFVIPEPGQTSV